MRDDDARSVDLLIVSLIIVMSLIEAIFLASDLDIIDRPLRNLAYLYGGFWPIYLTGARPYYPEQPFAMFLSYAFLHGGPGHLAVNMYVFWSLGHSAIDRAGRVGLSAICIAAAIAGAALFAWFEPRSSAPMVGFSGALFGLAGALIAWEFIDRTTNRERLWPLVRTVLMMFALNVAVWYSLEGRIAWQTHLGGFVAGWTLALFIGRNHGKEHDDAGTA